MQLKFAFKHRFALFFGLLLSFIIFLCHSCTLNDVFTDDPDIKLTFSDDTLQFDTVFTTMGSTTNYFLAFNKSASKVKISNIRLGNGSQSAYRINVDGINGYEFKDVELWANDSLYIFVEVTIDPTDLNTPFVVQDSVIFETNGNLQYVPLVAWGQNAHFFGPNTPNGYLVGTTADTTWTNDKPYVIYDGIIIDSLRTLTIEQGTRIYLHNNAFIFVKGSLRVSGGQDTSTWVQFKGTRLEQWYKKVPGQWGGIWLLRGSTNNQITGALIENSVVGIRIDSLPISGTAPNLQVQNSIIRNISDSGIIGITAVISDTNTFIYNCGKHVLQLEYGGFSAFNHRHLLNYGGNSFDGKPIIRVGNYFDTGTQLYLSNITEAQFYNCIIDGGEDENLELTDITKTQNYTGPAVDTFNVQFYNSVIRTKETTTNPIFHNCLFNLYRGNLFADISQDDYRPKENAPTINAGLPNVETTNPLAQPAPADLLGKTRDAQPDIGCFEF